jgi:hypothetical protein
MAVESASHTGRLVCGVLVRQTESGRGKALVLECVPDEVLPGAQTAAAEVADHQVMVWGGWSSLKSSSRCQVMIAVISALMSM